MQALYLDDDGLSLRDEWIGRRVVGSMAHAARPGVRKVLLDCGPES
jgi:hypothetical protein